MKKPITPWPLTDVVVLSPVEVTELQEHLRRDLAELDMLMEAAEKGIIPGIYSGIYQ